MVQHFSIAWADERATQVFTFEWSETEAGIVRHPEAPRSIEAGPQPDAAQEDRDYLETIASEVAQADEILILGRGSAHMELLKYISEQHPLTARKVVGFGTLSQPRDAELLNYAKRFFRHRMPERAE